MASGSFDITRKFVRVMGTLPNGMIEFEFAVGDPDVCAELVMPKAAFEAFCADNQVEFLNDMTKSDGDAADFQWGMHQATHQRFR